ncbi:MAG: aromatic ring-hydroxylating dioxygenase subunit alpha [Novosphingobium sp.]|nr:MAG: aromatic ring-hydroxylating dioxygenase subunit alpha [Novosphingobium sp.]
MTTRPGAVIDQGPLIAEIDFAAFAMRVSTARYHAADHHRRERERLWMRVWQAAGRAYDIPEAGDWMEYRLFDQSFLIVRGRDDRIRGFVNACRHRGNALCEGKGRSARFTCPYHNWSYGLDGKLLAVAKPDFAGSLEDFVGCKDELGLVEVPIECFAGFVFLNPDRAAAPLREFLGEIADLLAPYRLEEMIPAGLNVREALECNWKVVMDAFQEGYHIQAVHPELVAAMDESQERYGFFGDHSVATGPFGAANLEAFGPESQAASIRGLPATFPGVIEVLPRFELLLDGHRDGAGVLSFPAGVTGRLLLQQATRETLEAKGLDVSDLTDTQMSDNHFHLVFPNLFMTIRAGEATVILSTPHPDGDPGRCHWLVQNLMWLPPDERAAKREPLREVPEGEHVPYFLALEQDWEMMQRQQRGLRNAGLDHMALTRQEVRLAHYHSVLDGWVGETEPMPKHTSTHTGERP